MNKSTGLDGISAKILKICRDCLTPAIASIINSSIETGEFPDELKVAGVIPLHKGGTRDDPNNYRAKNKILFVSPSRPRQKRNG